MHCIAFGTTGGQGKFLLTPRDADLPFSFLFCPCCMPNQSLTLPYNMHAAGGQGNKSSLGPRDADLPFLNMLESLASSAVRAAGKVQADLIIVYTATGERSAAAMFLPPMSLSLAPDWGSHSMLGVACKVK
jgi:hypothetical protein